MSNKEDYSQFTKTTKKSTEKLKTYKEKLKKELDDLKLLAGETPTESSLRNNSESISPNPNFPETELSKLKPPPSISKIQLEILAEENSMLKIDIESLKNRNFKLQTENNSLRRELDTLKSEQAKISILESQINSLRENINSLTQEKETLKKSTIQASPKVLPEDHIKIEQSVIVVEELHPKDITPTQEELKKSRKKAKKPKKKKLSQEEIKAIQEEHAADTPVRRRCPTCLNLNKKYIRELDDKDNIIMQNPKIYGKKYRCGICSTEWR